MGGDTLEENSYARLELYHFWVGRRVTPHTLLWMKMPVLGVSVLRKIEVVHEPKTPS
jgi:hypothetical protein